MLPQEAGGFHAGLPEGHERGLISGFSPAGHGLRPGQQGRS